MTSEKTIPTEGMRALNSTLDRRGISNADLARLIGCKPSLVSRWRRGKRRPDRTSAQRLHEALGIKPALWDEMLGKRSSPPPRAA